MGAETNDPNDPRELERRDSVTRAKAEELLAEAVPDLTAMTSPADATQLELTDEQLYGVDLEQLEGELSSTPQDDDSLV